MFRFVLLILVALAVAAYFPSSRAVLLDVAEPAVTPMLRWQGLNEMKEIANEVKAHERERFGRLPDRREWADWLGRNFKPETGVDPWGSAYQLRAERDSFHIVSPGPDGVFRTDDDLSLGRPLASAGR